MGWTAGRVARCTTTMMLAAAGPVWGQTKGESPAGDGGATSLPVSTPWTLPPVTLERITGPIELDGIPDEAAWRALPLLETVQHWPDFGAPPTERTEIRIGHDDEFLYAAGWFYDEPGGVRGNSLRRDGWDGDDSFDLVVDGFNDDQTALKFTTTPLGILVDQEVLNDAAFSGGVDPLNGDWNTFWDAATAVTDKGWFAEMRIPLSSLGFSAEDGEAIMGIIAARYIARKDEKHIFPAIPPEWDLAEFKPSRARDVRLEGVSEQRPLWITPYALTGVERIRDPDADRVRAPSARVPTELGVDVKYGLSSNLTLDLTVNTDFAQVEGDALEVNLDRFGLFFPEKRQFFQERSSVFDFNVGEGRLFHSRRIGLSQDGDPVRILGGARLAGRLGDWDVGVLSMQVDGAPGAPGENDGVVRVRRTFSAGHQAGGMLTSRIDGDGRVDLSGGLDGRVALGSDLVTLQVAGTRNGTGPGAGSVQGAMARLFWERRTLDGLGYDLDAIWSGRDYDPALGFETRRDFSAVKARVRYSWQPAAGSAVTRWNLITAARAYLRNEDGVLETGLFRLRGFASLRGGHWANLALNLTREDVAEGFDLPGATVPAGRYEGWDAFAYVGLSQARAVGAGLQLWGGTAFDGWRANVVVEPWWRLNRHLTIGGMLSLNRLWFPDRAQTVNADQLRLRVSAALDTHLSAEAFVQYSAAARVVSTNLRIRYRFAEGRDLYLVLDEGRDLEDRHGLDSAILGRTDRRLLIKYSYAFRP